MQKMKSEIVRIYFIFINGVQNNFVKENLFSKITLILFHRKLKLNPTLLLKREGLALRSDFLFCILAIRKKSEVLLTISPSLTKEG
jgi:hypothetical protein